MLCNAFETLDLQPIMNRVRTTHNLDDNTTARAEMLYRQFLQLHKKHPDAKLIPSRLVDVVWHEHLLDSQKYIADCEALFGNYLHHNPGIIGEGSPYWQQTKELYVEEFGIDIETLGLGAGDCHKCTT